MNNDPAAIQAAVIKANLDRIIDDFAANPKIFQKIQNPISPETGNFLFLMSSGSPS